MRTTEKAHQLNENEMESMQQVINIIRSWFISIQLIQILNIIIHL